MKHRAWLVASFVLGITGGLLLWHLMGANPGPTPLETPDYLTRAPDIDVPVTNPFSKADSLPSQLSIEDFSQMVEQFSEPGGSFRYENYLSNERSYQHPIPELLKRIKPGGVYVGVGPEQNFTYIAALRPAMAFIVDIRRQNMIELLLYKALFAMAANRSEFASMLFARRPSRQLQESVIVEDLFGAFAGVSPDSALAQTTLQRIHQQLGLSRDDQNTVDELYRVFVEAGPDLTYSSMNLSAPAGPSYQSLMTMTDTIGRNWSYLASEENFRFIKEMQRKNLIVPLVGNFSGPKALRTIAKYLEDHKAKVSVFYVSNVEMYILTPPQWKNFCENVAALPMDQSSVFIRFLVGPYARARSRDGIRVPNVSVIGPMIDVLTGVVKGYPPSYYDLINASR